MSNKLKKSIHLFVPETGLWVVNMNGSIDFDGFPNKNRAFPSIRAAKIVANKLLKEDRVVAVVTLI